MGLAVSIADAVATELNAAPAGTFSQEFAASRKVLPEFNLTDLVELKVTVVPKSIEITGGTRVANTYEFAIDVGVQKKLGKDLDTDVASLGTFVDELADYLRRRPMEVGTHMLIWAGIRNEPVYAPEHLAEQRVFTSVLTVTYRMMR